MPERDFLLELDKETLVDLLEDAAKNWLAHDGLWFQAVEKGFGMDAALKLDAQAWKIFTQLEAMRIMRQLEIDPGGRLLRLDVREKEGSDVLVQNSELTLRALAPYQPLPESFPDIQAAPLLCAGVIGYRSLRISGIQPGQKLGLYGFGASAHLVIQVARHWDCDVYVFTRSAEHQQHARDLGAVWVGQAQDEARQGELGVDSPARDAGVDRAPGEAGHQLGSAPVASSYGEPRRFTQDHTLGPDPFLLQQDAEGKALTVFLLHDSNNIECEVLRGEADRQGARETAGDRRPFLGPEQDDFLLLRLNDEGLVSNCEFSRSLERFSFRGLEAQAELRGDGARAGFAREGQRLEEDAVTVRGTRYAADETSIALVTNDANGVATGFIGAATPQAIANWSPHSPVAPRPSGPTAS